MSRGYGRATGRGGRSAHEDTEVTFADLKARIAETIAFIESIKAAQIDGTEDKEITRKIGERDFLGG